MFLYYANFILYRTLFPTEFVPQKYIAVGNLNQLEFMNGRWLIDC